MHNIIITYDHLDEHIGENFHRCYLHLKSELTLTNYKVQVLSGEDCSSQKVQEAITALCEEIFIFIAYSHGKEDAFLSTIEPYGYVTPQNAYFFGNSLIYTNSCYSALSLKKVLLESKCLGYVGYEGEVLLPSDTKEEILFIACENKGIIHFLTTDDTLFQSVRVMKDYYEATYDDLATRDFVLASRLLFNKEYLVVGGNDQLTRNDFIIPSYSPAGQ